MYALVDYEISHSPYRIRTFRSEKELELYLINEDYKKRYPYRNIKNFYIKRADGRLPGWCMSAKDYIRGGYMECSENKRNTRNLSRSLTGLG